MLLGIRIQNYRYLTHMTVGMTAEDVSHHREDPLAAFSAGLTPVFPLANLTAFVGKNDTGKSVFMDALSFLSDTLRHGCRSSSTMSGRTGFSVIASHPEKPVSFSLLFSMPLYLDGNTTKCYISYDLRIEGDRNGRPFISHESVKYCPMPTDGHPADPKSFRDVLVLENGVGKVIFDGSERKAGVADSLFTGVSAYGSLLDCPILTALYQEITHWFFCHFSHNGSHGRNENQAVAPGAHRHLNPMGSNAKNVLKYIEKEDPERYQRLVQKIKEKIPTVSHKGGLPDFFKESPNKLFLYLLLLEDAKPNPLVFMETPSEGLYHDMVDVLAVEFREYVLHHPQSQLFFTTHNPYILESLAPDEVWVFHRDDTREHSASAHCVATSPIVSKMYEQGVGMGAIWYAGHFEDEA